MTDSPDRARILHADTVCVPSRFNGPPGLGQGGYSAWLAAQPLAGAAAADLRRPVPLERPLQRTLLESGRTELRDGGHGAPVAVGGVVGGRPAQGLSAT